jgi:aminomuconate-semialdehyde/2-hydroxymuconate-6-semialdehyde dehydrogenase
LKLLFTRRLKQIFVIKIKALKFIPQGLILIYWRTLVSRPFRRESKGILNIAKEENGTVLCGGNEVIVKATKTAIIQDQQL